MRSRRLNGRKLNLKTAIDFNAETQRHRGRKDVFVHQPSTFERQSIQFDEKKTKAHGKIFILDHDTNNNGKIDIEDLEWKYLEGDGDFRSNEVKRLRDESDIIVTNPPFSLFREFLAWILEGDVLTQRRKGAEVAEKKFGSSCISVGLF